MLRGHLAAPSEQVRRADESEALVEMDNALLNPQRAPTQIAHHRRQLLENVRRAAEVLPRELDPVALTQRLGGRQFAFVDSALQQQPGGDLHEAGGEPHALGRIGERGHSRKSARLRPPGSIEVGGGLLDQRHSFPKQVLEGWRGGEAMNEGDSGRRLARGRVDALPSVVRATHTLHSDPGAIAVGRSAARALFGDTLSNYSAAGARPRVHSQVTLTLGGRLSQRAKKSRPKAAFKEFRSEASNRTDCEPIRNPTGGSIDS